MILAVKTHSCLLRRKERKKERILFEKEIRCERQHIFLLPLVSPRPYFFHLVVSSMYFCGRKLEISSYFGKNRLFSLQLKWRCRLLLLPKESKEIKGGDGGAQKSKYHFIHFYSQGHGRSTLLSFLFLLSVLCSYF